MKTLDEVIEAIERQWICPSNDEADEYCELYAVRYDALHYLKEYQSQAKNFDYDELQELRDWYAEEQLNPALSWDELKQMVGKPVWMEDDTGTKHYRGWAIILEFLYSDTFILYVCNDYSETCVDVEDIGKTWQAYRKERHENS